MEKLNNPFLIATFITIFLIFLVMIILTPRARFKDYIKFFLYSWFFNIGILYLHNADLKSLLETGAKEGAGLSLVSKVNINEIEPEFTNEKKKINIFAATEDELI